MVTRIEIATRPGLQDPRGQETRHKIRHFLGIPVERVRTCEVYRIDAELRDDEPGRILREFADPVSQIGALDRLEIDPSDFVVTVGYKPGVTDPVGKSARVAIEDTLGRSLGDEAAVYCSRLYLLEGVDRSQARRIAGELLANPVIQTTVLQTWDEWTASEPDLSVPRVADHPTPPPATIDLSGDDEELTRISREGLLALELPELRAIRDHFRSQAGNPARRRLGLGAQPTDAELECLAQTWSEHCKHKIFNATITYSEEGRPPETLRSLFATYIQKVTHEIDQEVNSPSALDPYGGAITGIVGVNRDPFGTGIGSDLLANVWGYCFASPLHDGPLPRGLLHPRRIRDGVHEGVIDGGNQSGIPYGRGWEIFDQRYLGKPLVFCGTVGSLPVRVAGRPGEEKAARPGDHIVMTGGRIGADGIHGATFSSAALDESSPVQAVQIGDPITQKMMFDFLLEARDLGLYSAITDNGAGGLSSSVGEMARGPGGARLDLSSAPLKYQGLAPWEILISEAQERMTLAVPPGNLDRFLELARRRQVEATVLGEFTDDGTFHVVHGETTVAHLSMEFLHEGAPDLDLKAHWVPPRFDEPPASCRPATDELNDLVLTMLQRLNLASGETKARHYDHEVKGLSVVKPFIGIDGDVPADATVFLARHGSRRGFVLSEGVNPFYSDIDTHAMAAAVVDEAVRRQLCAGARTDRIALLDNFCWPDPVESERTPDGAYKLAQLVRACRGLYETCRAYGAPLISGKDSMKNDSTMGGVRISVPPTLLVSAIGQMDDVMAAVTLEPLAAGDVVFMVGTTRDECGGSEYYRCLGDRGKIGSEPGRPRPYVGDSVPRLDTEETRPLYRALARAHEEGLIQSATTPAKGGLAPALARCVMASRLGLAIDLGTYPDLANLPADVALFSESNGRFVLTTRPDHARRLADLFDGLPCRRVGIVTEDARLRVHRSGEAWLDLGADALKTAFKEGQET